VRGVRAPSSYGYGLRVVDEPSLGTVVTHSGGLPGYGSNMRWLPGRRIGAVALSNVTYAPMWELTARLIDTLDARGLVPASVTAVSPAVAAAAERLIAVLNDWNDVAAGELGTASLALDEPIERRRAAAATLIERTGRLTVASIEAATAARATVRCAGESGHTATVDFMLAPAPPPRIQSYTATIETGSIETGTIETAGD
jgi:hypothetical protein